MGCVQKFGASILTNVLKLGRKVTKSFMNDFKELKSDDVVFKAANTVEGSICIQEYIKQAK
eukprot:gene6628-2595_t